MFDKSKFKFKTGYLPFESDSGVMVQVRRRKNGNIMASFYVDDNCAEEVFVDIDSELFWVRYPIPFSKMHSIIEVISEIFRDKKHIIDTYNIEGHKVSSLTSVHVSDLEKFFSNFK